MTQVLRTVGLLALLVWALLVCSVVYFKQARDGVQERQESVVLQQGHVDGAVIHRASVKLNSLLATATSNGWLGRLRGDMMPKAGRRTTRYRDGADLLELWDPGELDLILPDLVLDNLSIDESTVESLGGPDIHVEECVPRALKMLAAYADAKLLEQLGSPSVQRCNNEEYGRWVVRWSRVYKGYPYRTMDVCGIGLSRNGEFRGVGFSFRSTVPDRLIVNLTRQDAIDRAIDGARTILAHFQVQHLARVGACTRTETAIISPNRCHQWPDRDLRRFAKWGEAARLAWIVTFKLESTGGILRPAGSVVEVHLDSETGELLGGSLTM